MICHEVPIELSTQHGPGVSLAVVPMQRGLQCRTLCCNMVYIYIYMYIHIYIYIYIEREREIGWFVLSCLGIVLSWSA